MINTNSIPRKDGEQKKVTVLVTNKVEMRAQELRPRTFPGLDIRTPRKYTGPMLTVTAMEDQKRAAKRQAAADELKKVRSAAQVKPEGRREGNPRGGKARRPQK